MDNFFKAVDGFIMDNPSLLAKEYLRYVLDNPMNLYNKKHNAFFVTNNNNHLSEIKLRVYVKHIGITRIILNLLILARTTVLLKI